MKTGRVWRNFMGYTTNRGMELLGIGCSSISEFGDLFAQNLVSPEIYGEVIHSGNWAVHRGHQLDHEDRVRKQLINHLMCNLEIEIPAEARAGGNGLLESLQEALESLRPFVAEGLIIERPRGFAVTPLGQLFLRNLAMPFDRYLAQQTGATFSRTV
jgi:oxygen-independent coproporphyrinogen-3 oxidase